MSHDPEVLAETRSWFLKGSRDLEAGTFELTAASPFTEDAVFHAQQAAEKALKFRYPGEPEEPSREEADEALALAREVYDAVLARLPQEVRP
jgi:HEPN domain-containing protein